MALLKKRLTRELIFVYFFGKILSFFIVIIVWIDSSYNFKKIKENRGHYDGK